MFLRSIIQHDEVVSDGDRRMCRYWCSKNIRKLVDGKLDANIEPNCKERAGEMFPSRVQFMPQYLEEINMSPGCHA